MPGNDRFHIRASVNTRAPPARPPGLIDRHAMQVYRCANGADQSRRVSRGVANEARCGRIQTRRRTPLYICNSAAGVSPAITSVNTPRTPHDTIRRPLLSVIERMLADASLPFESLRLTAATNSRKNVIFSDYALAAGELAVLSLRAIEFNRCASGSRLIN